MPERTVVFLVYPGFQALDLAGPHEVFSSVDAYRRVVAAPERGPVPSESGLPVYASHGIADIDPATVDTLVVAGGNGCDAACADPRLVAWVAAVGARARRTASVCSGVFLLAAAGLLTGRTVTTHWGRGAQFRREYPELRLDVEPIFIHDGPIWSSAGVTAGMDLALALVEDDLGHAAAHTIAQHLVLHLRRPGNQSQFSAPLWSVRPASDPIRLATEAVARRCGFGTAETLRRTFHRRLGVSPTDYRDRFRTTKGRP